MKSLSFDDFAKGINMACNIYQKSFIERSIEKVFAVVPEYQENDFSYLGIDDVDFFDVARSELSLMLGQSNLSEQISILYDYGRIHDRENYARLCEMSNALDRWCGKNAEPSY